MTFFCRPDDRPASFCGPLSDCGSGASRCLCGPLRCSSPLRSVEKRRPEQLIARRFAQGLGGSVGMTTGMAIIRDLLHRPCRCPPDGVDDDGASVSCPSQAAAGNGHPAFAPWLALFVLL